MNPSSLTLCRSLVLGSLGAVSPLKTPDPKSFCSLSSQISGNESNAASLPPRGVHPTLPSSARQPKFLRFVHLENASTPGRAPGFPSFGVCSFLGIRSSGENPGKQQGFVGEAGEATGKRPKPLKPPQNQPVLLEGDPDLPEPDFRMGKL